MAGGRSVSVGGGCYISLAIAFFAGATFVVALPPLSLAPMALLAFATLFVALDKRIARWAFVIGWAFGLGQFAVGISWIAESFYIDADRFGALAVPAVAALAAVLALFPAFAALIYAKLVRLRAFSGAFARAVVFAAAWTGGEWLRGHVLTGFPWNLAAYTLADLTAMRQPAAWVGSYGLSFLVVLAGGWLGAGLLGRGRARALPIGLAFALVAVTWGAGAWQASRQSPPESGIRLRIVQGNIPQAEKWGPGSRERMLETYLRLSERSGRFDVLLWPETAFPGFLDEDSSALARIAEILPEGAILLTGAPDRVNAENGTRYLNTIQALDQRGEILTRYAKHHLVPFGEYVPLREWLPLPRIVESLGDFTPGPGPRTLALSGVPPVAPAICYEVIFPGHVIDRLLRPEWIFNATNDAWFGTTFGPEQHLASARMRAVEEGLPVIRAANTGISSVIDARGNVIRRLDLDRAGIVDAALPSALPPTLYSRIGDLALPPLILMVWLGTAFGMRYASGSAPSDVSRTSTKRSTKRGMSLWQMGRRVALSTEHEKNRQDDRNGN